MVGRAHVGLGYGQPVEQALDGEPPAAGLAQVVLVAVEAAEPQGDGGPLASAGAFVRPFRALHAVGVNVEVGRGVVLVVGLHLLGRLHQLRLATGGARTASAAASVATL